MIPTSRAAIVIPARMGSIRFPNKPLASIRGKVMIERVWRIASAVSLSTNVFIATDDEGLRRYVEQFGAQVLMTSPSCQTGSDRVAEACCLLKPTPSIVFNLQGDAVLTPPWVIEAVLQAMLADPSIAIATPAVELKGLAKENFIALKKMGSTSGTSVVFDQKGNALYFSKSLLPFCRDAHAPLYQHIGLYAYRVEALQTLSRLPETPLEKAEKLEQLRALEHGMAIRVILVDYRGRTHGSVDRPEDVAVVEKIIDQEGELLP